MSQNVSTSASQPEESLENSKLAIGEAWVVGPATEVLNGRFPRPGGRCPK